MVRVSSVSKVSLEALGLLLDEFERGMFLRIMRTWDDETDVNRIDVGWIYAQTIIKLVLHMIQFENFALAQTAETLNQLQFAKDGQCLFDISKLSAFATAVNDCLYTGKIKYGEIKEEFKEFPEHWAELARWKNWNLATATPEIQAFRDSIISGQRRWDPQTCPQDGIAFDLLQAFIVITEQLLTFGCQTRDWISSKEMGTIETWENYITYSGSLKALKAAHTGQAVESKTLDNTKVAADHIKLGPSEPALIMRTGTDVEMHDYTMQDAPVMV